MASNDIRKFNFYEDYLWAPADFANAGTATGCVLTPSASSGSSVGRDWLAHALGSSPNHPLQFPSVAD